MKKKGEGTGNLAIAAILLLFVGINVAVVLVGRGAGETPGPSTYSTHDYGAKALFLTLSQRGYNVKRNRRGLDNIPPDADVFVILEPLYEFQLYELDYLTDWVEDGGTLITGIDCRNSVLPEFDFIMSTGIGTFKESLTVENEMGLLEEVNRIGPVYSAGASEFPIKTIPLIYRNNSALFAISNVNSGKIIAGPFETLFSNSEITSQDNARLAFNIFDEFRNGETIYFDEFHHGYTEAGEKPMYSLRDAIFSSPYGLFVLQALLACLVLFFNRDGVKFIRGNGRKSLSASPLEFVNAGAELYARARAHSESAGAMIKIFNRDLNRMLGLPHDSTFEEAARRFSTNSIKAKNILTLARFRDNIAAGVRISRADGLETAQIIEDLREELKSKRYE